MALSVGVITLSSEDSKLHPSSFAKASEDTPSSNDLRVACHPKLEELPFPRDG
jgi:hypothetical protein